MPFDAVFLDAALRELRAQAVCCRIDKVQQPERDTVILHLRGACGGGRLLLTASPNHPRIQMTDLPMENPAQPPMFCMLLRKHLTGARIVSVTQPHLERLADLELECTDEMGEQTRKHLILEIMGRNSNLILTDADGHIIDCLRRVDFALSADRQVLPGLFYRLPPAQEKLDGFAQTEASLSALLAEVPGQKQFDRWLLDSFGGFSPLLCRELTCRVFGDVDVDIGALSEQQRQSAAAALFRELQTLQTGEKTPVLLVKDGRPWDFTCIPIRQYGSFVTQQTAESFSQLLDRFYGEHDRQDSLRQKTQTLRKLLTNLRSRTARKLELQKKELADSQDRETLRRRGDIVTANLYAIRRGQTVLRAVDFYDPDMKQTEIHLDPALSPQQNAAKFYKDYQKAKNAEKILTEQIEKGGVELEYLGSVLDALCRAETERDVTAIRQELLDGGYLRQTDRKKQMKLPPTKPMSFRSSQGFAIYVGRNNRQNDLLTCKQAAKNDLWLHVQKIHGSHVIIETGGRPVPDETVTEAMILAAYYSQARDGQNVPVDYTAVKNVKKPVGSKPGMVIYEHYATGCVTPDAALAEKLKEH